MTDTLTLPSRDVAATRWRFTSPIHDGTVPSTTATHLRQFNLHPHLEKPLRARIAPVFLNGPLSRYRADLSMAADFASLFSIADGCIDREYVNRLRFLKAEDPRLTADQVPMSIESTKTALLLLLNYNTVIPPELVITAAGHVQLEWEETDYRRLVVECISVSEVRFVVMYDLEYATALCKAGHLVSKLAPYPIWHWFHGGR